MEGKDQKKKINIDIDDDVYTFILSEAKEYERSFVAMIRHILKEYVKSKKED